MYRSQFIYVMCVCIYIYSLNHVKVYIQNRHRSWPAESEPAMRFQITTTTQLVAFKVRCIFKTSSIFMILFISYLCRSGKKQHNDQDPLLLLKTRNNPINGLRSSTIKLLFRYYYIFPKTFDYKLLSFYY